MSLLRTLFTTAFVVIFSLTAMAQKDFLKEANTAYAQERYYEAIELYKKAYTREGDKNQKAFVIFRIGECYRFADNPKQSEVWYGKAVKASYSDPIAIYYLAEAKKLNGNLEGAAEEYQNYVNKKPNDKKGKDGLRSVELAMEWMKNPTRYEVEVAPIINSEFDDFSPNFADNKNNVLYFTSSRESATGDFTHERTGQGMTDIFTSTRDRKGKWSEPVPLNETVNSEASEGTICMNKRRNTLYFTRCDFEKGNEVHFGCSIYWSKKSGKDWGDAELIPITADTNTVGHPAITNDDKVLIFASDMPGGYGGRDLWYIINKGRDVWSEPINMGSTINTAGDELYPYIAFDDKLYFSSNGHIGMGGLDIFSAESIGENKWGNVKNLEYPINSFAHDFGIVWDGDKNRGYLSSEREGDEVLGGTDIWEFYWPPLVFALEGIAMDKETEEPIAGATIDLVGTDGTTAQVVTDAKGEFKFAEKGSDRYIKENTSYSITVGADQYLVAKGNETTVGEPESKVFYHEYKLQPVAKPIVLPEVLFELAKWDLLPQSKDSLDFLYAIMVDNPTIIIELSAHTDSRDSDARNKTLSQKRAESCVDYLVSKGIPRGRMTAVGYGESRLKVSDAAIAKVKSKEEKEALHQKNRRVEFEVKNFNWVPK